MRKSLCFASCLGAFAAGALLFSVPANAQAAGCSGYRPGMLAFVTGVRPAPCAYQGDYMVDQGPAYTGPARVAPQSTYAPTRTAAGYPYVHGQYKMEPAPGAEKAAVRQTTVKKAAVKKTTTTKSTTVKKTDGKRMTVKVKNELPPAKGAPTKGKPQIIKAQAEVRIYGPERMEIRLFRR